MTREEAKSRLEWICKNHKCLSLESKHCYEAIKMGVEALENQKTGHWIDYGAKYDVRCSICNTQYPLKPISSSRLIGCKSDYCPGCGAKMEGE